ncbi:hypothetical protein DFH01_22955 [Falsiroseomonas bella]|uniref:Uncharacterized protein n=1 Tax=Falsiroseomonas bella TaxID=2184016 RepID=A0A317FB72_9PROT|nr:hypothetical protein [Falsiroseomonas bella]PWS35169.1 hypothetical protein DFH01_22955 [Falsiroseomonas bella]
MRPVTVKELEAAEKITSPYVSRVLRLTLLAPGIVEAILDGRQPEGMTLPGLMEPLPLVWEAQRKTVSGRTRCGWRLRAPSTSVRACRLRVPG